MVRTQLTVVAVMIVLLLLVVRVVKLLTSYRTKHVSHGLMVASTMAAHVASMRGHGTHGHVPGGPETLLLRRSDPELLRHQTVGKDRTLLQTIRPTL